jgi:hypothetical protein
MFAVNTRTRKQYDLFDNSKETTVRNTLNKNKWKYKIKGGNKMWH